VVSEKSPKRELFCADPGYKSPLTLSISAFSFLEEFNRQELAFEVRSQMELAEEALSSQKSLSWPVAYF